jgi:hypothetical protein
VSQKNGNGIDFWENLARFGYLIFSVYVMCQTAMTGQQTAVDAN